jgi:hypothetical protein
VVLLKLCKYVQAVKNMRLGEGSYGCVVRPAVPCRNNMPPLPDGDPADFVSKFFVDKAEAAREMELAKGLRVVDPDGAFTVQPVMASTCKADPDKADEVVAAACVDHGDELLRKQFMTQNVYPFAGSPVHTLDRRLGALAYGLVKFEAAGLVHMDIKVINALENDATGEVKFIDFGTMEALDGVYVMPSEYTTKYFAWPPEFNLLITGGIKSYEWFDELKALGDSAYDVLTEYAAFKLDTFSFGTLVSDLRKAGEGSDKLDAWLDGATNANVLARFTPEVSAELFDAVWNPDVDSDTFRAAKAFAVDANYGVGRSNAVKRQHTLTELRERLTEGVHNKTPL